MKTLDYIRADNNRPKPWPRTGFVYLHHFGTGHQELVFTTHQDAAKFAEREECKLTQPKGKP